MGMLDNFLKTYSRGEEFNTKDFNLIEGKNVDSVILNDIKTYLGRPLSVLAGKIIPFNGSSFYCILANDCGKYGIGITSPSIAITKKGVRVVASEGGIVEGDLIKISGTGADAKFVKGMPTDINVAIGTAVCKSFKDGENIDVVAIDFNTAMIKDLEATPASLTNQETNQPSK